MKEFVSSALNDCKDWGRKANMKMTREEEERAGDMTNPRNCAGPKNVFPHWFTIFQKKNLSAYFEQLLLNDSSNFKKISDQIEALQISKLVVQTAFL